MGLGAQCRRNSGVLWGGVEAFISMAKALFVYAIYLI